MVIFGGNFQCVQTHLTKITVYHGSMKAPINLDKFTHMVANKIFEKNIQKLNLMLFRG